MLLVIDVGNTNTVLGVFAPVAHRPGEDVTAEAARYERLVANWRVGSHLTRTVDEYGVIFRNLFSMDNLEVSDVHGIVISSVVPPLDPV
jgi:type III pantothenate kinase